MIRNMTLSLHRFSTFVVTKNIEGVTEEEGFRNPEAGGSSINWVLGHIVATRNHALRLVGADPIWADGEILIYSQGTLPVADRSKAISLEKLAADYVVAQERLAAVLESFSDEDLAGKGAEGGIGGESIGEQLAGIFFHEAYHAGQIGILRRAAGKPGMIA